MTQLLKFLLALNVWVIAAHDRTLDRAYATMRVRASARRRDERGSVTIEQVLWAGAVIVIVGVVVAAITAYVKSESGKIK